MITQAAATATDKAMRCGFPKKVILGLSGGVDSATAALILLSQDYEVTGLYFDIDFYAKPEDSEGYMAAKATADALGIVLLYRNLDESFNDIVISNFCSEYLNGRTPNPCIICNPHIKFKALMDAMKDEGAEYIATGHYARKEYDENSGIWHISTAANYRKDQSYMLYRLPKDVTEHLLLPLGSIEDKEVTRAIAENAGLSIAHKADSQDICFIEKGRSYVEFLEDRGHTFETGDFLDMNGNIIGNHQGFIKYTIGQRKGLGQGFGKKVFVTSVDSNKNTVTIGSDEDLFRNTVDFDGAFFIGEKEGTVPSKYLGNDCDITAKIRYAASPKQAVLSLRDGSYSAEFKEAQRAPSPGQSIVFYIGNTVIGGGFIK